MRATRLAIAVALVSTAGTAFAVTYIGPKRYEPQRLHITGHITGLYPGAKRRMRVKVRNPHDHAVRLRFVGARVRSMSRQCPRRNLVVRRSRRRLRIPPHRTRRLWLRVLMRAAAPAGCQDAEFRLRFRAAGRRR
jgi:hypothetical protein